MKVKIRNRVKEFEPFEVVFTIQSPEDLREFRKVFGDTPAKFGGEGADLVYDKLKQMIEESK